MSIKLKDVINMSENDRLKWFSENGNNFMLQKKPIDVSTIEDVGIVGEDILVWDGCTWDIDYVDVCPDSGLHYMAGNTEIKSYMPLYDYEDEQ